MKLSEVPIVTESNVDVIVETPGDGQRTKRTESVDHKFYDFGPDNKGHEEHVKFRIEEFTCAQHDEYQADCDGCNYGVFGIHDGTTEIDGIADHLRKSRGIVIDP